MYFIFTSSIICLREICFRIAISVTIICYATDHDHFQRSAHINSDGKSNFYLPEERIFTSSQERIRRPEGSRHWSSCCSNRRGNACTRRLFFQIQFEREVEYRSYCHTSGGRLQPWSCVMRLWRFFLFSSDCQVSFWGSRLVLPSAIPANLMHILLLYNCSW